MTKLPRYLNSAQKSDQKMTFAELEIVGIILDQAGTHQDSKKFDCLSLFRIGRNG